METSRDSSVGIALCYGLDIRGSRFRLPAGVGNFSLHLHVHSSEPHPASYPMGTRVSFFWGEGGRGMKLTTHLHLVPRSKNEWRYNSPNTPSWYGAQLKYRDNL
jgi:hypothetical protein